MRVTAVTSPKLREDTLTAQDYRDIYDEQRQKMTLRQFVDFIGSAVTFAWWSKYERHEAELNHERKNELRRLVGLPQLGQPVTAVSTLLASDVTVYRIGDDAANRAVLVGRDVPNVDLRVNGDIHILDAAQVSDVTAVTRARRNGTYKGVSLRVDTVKRLARTKNGRTLDALINDALDALERGA